MMWVPMGRGKEVQGVFDTMYEQKNECVIHLTALLRGSSMSEVKVGASNMSILKTYIWLGSVFVILCFCSLIFAHPGYGIVADGQGNIYFTDISRQTIWKIDAGKKLQAIAKGKWSHQLWMDGSSNLYFTDEEEIDGQRGYSLWKFSADGKLTELISPSLREDFPSDIFVIDDEGILYVADNTTIFWSRDYRRFQPLLVSGTTGGAQNPAFSGIRSMTVGADGWIYLVDDDKLKRITNEKAETISTGLIEENPPDIPIKNAPNPAAINRLFGLALDQDGAIYVAYFGNRRVLKISNKTEIEVYYKSEAPWSPAGVAVDGQGVIVKEHAFTEGAGWSGPRIIRIDDELKEEVLAEM